MTDAADRYIAACRAMLAAHKRERAAAHADKSLTAIDRVKLLAAQDAAIRELDSLFTTEINRSRNRI